MRSSGTTTVINKALQVKNADSSSNSNIEIAFTLPEELHHKASVLGQKIGLIKSGNYSVNQLILAFDQLCELSGKEDYQGLFNSKRFHIEKFKSAIMDAVYHYLKKFYHENKVIKEKKKSRWRRMRNWVEFGLFLFGDMVWFPSGIYFAYTGFRTLVPVILPAISSAVLLPVAVALTIVDISIQMLFKAVTIKDKFRITLGKRTKHFLDLYENQLRSTTKINELLHHPNVLRHLDRQDFHVISKLAVKFNINDIAHKKNEFEKIEHQHYAKEATWKRAIRWTIRGFKIFTTITGGYFAASTLVSIAFAPLIGTPVGWLLIGILMAGLLALYVSTMHYDALKQLFSPVLEQFKKIKQEFLTFTVVNNYDHIYSAKRLFKSAPRLTLEEQIKIEQAPKVELAQSDSRTSDSLSGSRSDCESDKQPEMIQPSF